MAGYDFDLFVIGAGSGGVRAARIAAGYGARVAVAEEFRIGGTCVIRGCVPKKLLVYASRFADAFEDAAGYGWSVGETAFDWPTLIARKDAEIARLSGIYQSNLEKAGVEIVLDRAAVSGPNEVRLVGSGRTITAGTILVATGSSPNAEFAFPGIEHTITSNEALHLDRLPERVLVVGGGYIAVEFAGIFHGLGAETTIMHRAREVLRGFDEEIRSGLHEEMERRGIHMACSETLDRVDRTPSGLVATARSGKTFEVDQVLLAIGRRPNTRDLGLEDVGVRLAASGAVEVDGYSQSSVPSIYAVGDVTDRANLTPVAIREGHAFADTVFGGRPTAVDHRTIPTAVFSQPEIGTVGLTQAEAKLHHAVVDVYRTRFRPMFNVMAGRDERTLMKIIVDGETDRVLGVHILGPDAGEMAQLVGIAVHMGATKADFDATMAVHPTAAEELVTMRTRSERFVREAAAE